MQLTSQCLERLSLCGAGLRQMATGFLRGGLVAVFLAATPAYADVADVVISDVTTRAFSVVWSSSEAVQLTSSIDDSFTTVQVFTASDGTGDISENLVLKLESDDVALMQGIVKFDVVDDDVDDVIELRPDTTFYLRTTTVGGSGTVVFPADGDDLLEVRTAMTTRKGDDDGNPIVNDVIYHEILDPDGTTPGDGSLLMVRVPSISAYPLTAFVADGFASPGTAVDMNNIFDDVTGESARVPAGAVVEIIEYRGLSCPGAANQRVRKLRRVPAEDGGPAITELKEADECFAPSGVSADFDCDGRIGGVDFTRFLANFALQAPDCRFNNDYDLDDDGRVGGVDFTRLLSVFGSEE